MKTKVTRILLNAIILGSVVLAFTSGWKLI
jgi:hypothetical protein